MSLAPQEDGWPNHACTRETPQSVWVAPGRVRVWLPNLFLRLQRVYWMALGKAEAMPHRLPRECHNPTGLATWRGLFKDFQGYGLSHPMRLD